MFIFWRPFSPDLPVHRYTRLTVEYLAIFNLEFADDSGSESSRGCRSLEISTYRGLSSVLGGILVV